MQDGPMNGQFGLAHVRANHFHLRVNERDLMTKDISGQNFTDSFGSLSLTMSLASKLQKKQESLGSTLYNQRWKMSATPLGRLLPQLVVSVPRTKEPEATGLAHWPTPQARDWKNGDDTRPGNSERSNDLNDFAILANWATPTATDSTRGSAETPEAKEKRGAHTGWSLIDHAALAHWTTPMATDVARNKPFKQGGQALSYQARLATWPTPASRDGKGGYRGGRVRNGKLSTDTLDVAAQLTDFGPTQSGSTVDQSETASQESGGQLKSI
jgi:hypothetical protein